MTSSREPEKDDSPPSTPTESQADYYNPVFAKLVDEAEHELVGFLAYGIYKAAKREWLSEHRERHGRRPTEPEYRQHADAQTPVMLERIAAKRPVCWSAIRRVFWNRRGRESSGMP